MNLTDSVRDWAIRNIPFDTSDTDVADALINKDAHALLVVYHNWRSRLIEPRPRRIEMSAAYKDNPLIKNFLPSLSAIELDVMQGNELTKYLSKGIRVALGVSKRRHGTSELDMLLNDWGVHHLHLSTELEPSGFVRRTGPLLFARFTADVAYFLDIANHGEWAKDSVIGALVEEFPDAGGVHVLKGVTGVSREYTDQEHQKLRSAGVNIIRMVRGKVAVGGGYNTQGRTTAAVRLADEILLVVEKFEADWKSSEEEVRNEIKAQNVILPDSPQFTFEIDEEGPMILEKVSRAAIRILNA